MLDNLITGRRREVAASGIRRGQPVRFERSEWVDARAMGMADNVTSGVIQY